MRVACKSLAPPVLVSLLHPSQFFLLLLPSTEPKLVGGGAGTHEFGGVCIFISLIFRFQQSLSLSYTQGVVRGRISGFPFCNFVSFGKNYREVGDSCALRLSLATRGSRA